MKRVIQSCSFLLLGVCFLFACKKGEDDPAFTLRTRKARVAGEWRMKEGNIKLSVRDSANPATDGLIYTLGESSYKLALVYNGGSFEGPFSLSITTEKDGKFTMAQTMDSVTVTGTGTWDFQDASDKQKSKEVINLQLETFVGFSGRFDLFNKSYSNFSYRIKELRNKRMVLLCDAELIDNNSKNQQMLVTAEYVFEQ